MNKQSREIAVIGHDEVFASVPSAVAIEEVRQAFIRFARGEWSMPAKVYLDAPSGGDFRAMPALGDGLALLKWVTSFPQNPSRGLPTVTGIILVNDSESGEPLALVDARAVTALRTGASAAVAATALARPGAESVGIVGCGLHGAWAARCLKEAGFGPGVCTDTDQSRGAELAEELGWKVGRVADALDCHLVTTVTPGRQTVIGPADLKPGMHINALGADGPGKAELEVEAAARCSVFCDEWTQASHGGEITAAVEKGMLDRAAVTELGEVLVGSAPGRRSDDEVTLFDSTGLAIQDLAIVRVLVEKLNDGSISSRSVSL